MLAVAYTDPEEYLTELRLEAANVTDQLVRVTCSSRRGQFGTLLHVLSTFVVRGQVVRLDKFVGEYIHRETTDFKEVSERADKLADMIRAEATKLGLQTRAGVYTVAPLH